MTTPTGVASDLAIKKASTWGTAVVLGANDKVVFREYGVDLREEIIPNNDLIGKGTRGFPESGNGVLEGPLRFAGDFDQVPQMLLAALMMGAAGAPTNVEAGVELHSFPYQPHTNGLFVSAGVVYGGADEHGHSSLKPTRRLINIPVNAEMEETYEFVGSGLDKTLATSGAWTYRTDPTDGNTKRILNRQMTVRANASSDGALGSGDAAEVIGAQIDINRNLDRAFAQANTPIEPASSDFQTIDIRLDFRRLTAGALSLWKDAKDSKTPLKMDIVLDHGVLLGATENRKREFYFPKLRVVECPLSINGPGALPFSVTLSAHAALSSPTGFPSGTTQEMLERWQNAYASDVLA